MHARRHPVTPFPDRLAIQAEPPTGRNTPCSMAYATMAMRCLTRSRQLPPTSGSPLPSLSLGWRMRARCWR